MRTDFTPNAQAFNGEGCFGDAGVVRIEVGASEALFSVRFSSPGTQVLSAAHEQFLAGTDFTVTVRPRVVAVEDAGIETPAPRALDVQCGCGSAGAVFALGVLALLRGLQVTSRA